MSTPGGMITLSPLILVDLLGVKMFNSSLGLCFMFRAIGMVLGTPVAGKKSTAKICYWSFVMRILSRKFIT